MVSFTILQQPRFEDRVKVICQSSGHQSSRRSQGCCNALERLGGGVCHNQLESNWIAFLCWPFNDANAYYRTPVASELQTWTVAQLQESPSRQWQIDSVTDSFGNQLNFAYDSVQHSGRWCVSSVTRQDAVSANFTYDTDRLVESNSLMGGQAPIPMQPIHRQTVQLLHRASV